MHVIACNMHVTCATFRVRFPFLGVRFSYQGEGSLRTRVCTIPKYSSPYPAPGDYESVSVNITFSPGGVVTQCVNITINDDLTIDLENPESFNLLIRRVTSSGISQTVYTSVVNLSDNDGNEIS